MAKYNEDQEYLLIINNIMLNEEFKKMEKIKHHNTNRLNHMLKVSYYSYKISKILKLDYEEVARAGLLHDFYTDEISKCKKLKDKIKLFSIKHPQDALINAQKYFKLSEKEINIIETHMFPMYYKLPKYAESWIVCLVDTSLSFSEFFNKFKYKLSYLFNLYLLFIINNIK